MTRTVHITLAEKMAAEALVERSAVTGRPVSPTIVKIANARRAKRPSTGCEHSDADYDYEVDAD